MTAADATPYRFTYCGRCLGALMPSGAEVVADPAAAIKIGDVVAVVLKQGEQGPFANLVNAIGGDGYLGVTKLFLGLRSLPSGETVYLVGQLNPPVISPIPASAVEAMHRVVDVGNAGEPDDVDLAAIDLLSCIDQLPVIEAAMGIAPINPSWSPIAQ